MFLFLLFSHQIARPAWPATKAEWSSALHTDGNMSFVGTQLEEWRKVHSSQSGVSVLMILTMNSGMPQHNDENLASKRIASS